MKKAFITLALLAMASTGVWARTLSPAEALSRALASPEAPQSATGMRAPAMVKADLTLKMTDSAEPALYVISRGEDQGAFIVAADDAAAPLLGWTDEGTFDPNNIPDNMRWWLEQYRDQISWASSEGIEYTEPALNTVAGMQRAARTNIAPLVTTRWNQDAPYNQACPTVSGQRTYTGCVATAMAQVCNYHKWPEKNGTGTFSYAWNNTTLSYDYSTANFDWDNMLNTYNNLSTASQKAAVANLMLACGVGVQMGYGTSASGALSQRVAGFLRDYMGYDKGISMASRYSYTGDEWEQLVYEQLGYGPIYYAGRAPDGGHAFVCDGYNSGYFHFNWGWGGMSDGYFKLDALSPESQGIGGATGGFNTNQDIVTGFRKPVEGSVLAAPEIVLEGPLNVYMSGVTMTLAGPFYNFSPYAVKGRLYLRTYNATTGEWVQDYMSRGTISVEPAYYLKSVDIAVGTLTEGQYKAYLCYKSNDGGEFYPVKLTSYDAGYILITVDGDKKFTAETVRRGNLTFGQAELLSPFYVGKMFGVNLPYTYESESQLYAQIYPLILSNYGSINKIGEVLNVNINPGQGVVQYVGSFSDLEVGDYKLAFGILDGYSSNGNSVQYKVISDVFDITVGTISNTTVVTVGANAWSIQDADNVVADDMKIDVTLKASYGYFAGEIVAHICTQGTTDVVGTISSGNVFVAQPNSVDFTIRGAFLEAEQGKTYDVYLYRNGTNRLTSTAKSFTVGKLSGISEIGAEAAEAPVEYFNLQGIKVTDPQGGLYIRRQGTKTTKVYIP